MNYRSAHMALSAKPPIITIQPAELPIKMSSPPISIAAAGPVPALKADIIGRSPPAQILPNNLYLKPYILLR